MYENIANFLLHLNYFQDSNASSADSDDNPVVSAMQSIRMVFPDLMIAADVCLCPYTDHGHCCIYDSHQRMDNEKSIARLAQISLKYALNGAHIIAPSDMMDNRVAAIKKTLHENRLGDFVSVLSYAVKFSSCFYGPFREAARSAPAYGDRKCYQLPVGSRQLAERAAVSGFFSRGLCKRKGGGGRVHFNKIRNFRSLIISVI